ncbi:MULTISPECIES: hypothetical protein [unclassified Anabaena]|uniref:hypothetical protein n=1 Tax=unclassified Anabaena TaxID=2619674 RepID=UPI0039C629CB
MLISKYHQFAHSSSICWFFLGGYAIALTQLVGFWRLIGLGLGIGLGIEVMFVVSVKLSTAWAIACTCIGVKQSGELFIICSSAIKAPKSSS